MHALPTADHAVTTAGPTSGRHRRPKGAPGPAGRPGRSAKALLAAGRAGSLVSMSALALLGTAIAAGLAQPLPAAERPTVVVTYDVGH